MATLAAYEYKVAWPQRRSAGVGGAGRGVWQLQHDNDNSCSSNNSSNNNNGAFGLWGPTGNDHVTIAGRGQWSGNIKFATLAHKVLFFTSASTKSVILVPYARSVLDPPSLFPLLPPLGQAKTLICVGVQECECSKFPSNLHFSPETFFAPLCKSVDMKNFARFDVQSEFSLHRN